MIEVVGQRGVDVGAGITVDSLTVVSPTLMTAQVTVAPSASIGFRTAQAETPSVGTQTRDRALFVEVGTETVTIPEIIGLNPATGDQGATVVVTVTGSDTNFTAGVTTADFGAGVTVGGGAVTDATTAVVQIQIAPDAEVGFRNVTLTTGGEVATILNGFFVDAAGGGPVTDQEPNDGFDTATNMGALPTVPGQPEMVTVNGQTGSVGDPLDGFFFTTTVTGSGGARLSNLTGNADLYVFSAGHQLIAVSNNPGTSEELLVGEIPAGAYFLGVLPVGVGPVSYQIELTFLPDRGGNTFATATDLGTVNPGELIVEEDVVGPVDPIDAFRFTTTVTGETGIRLSGLSANVNLFLWSEDGNISVSLFNVGSSEEFDTILLPAGTYYVWTQSAAGFPTAYRLEVQTAGSAANKPAASERVGSELVAKVFSDLRSEILDAL